MMNEEPRYKLTRFAIIDKWENRELTRGEQMVLGHQVEYELPPRFIVQENNDELYAPYEGLTQERGKWSHELKQGVWDEPYILKQYRLNRDSNLWRATREVEKLCEYILYLEGLNNKS